MVVEEARSAIPHKPSRRLNKLGIALTVTYLLAVGVIALTHRDVMTALTPSEWGDYLSGVFGPVAFLWLVLGYFQQGDELRYSAEALWLQGEELRNSVEQQRALVEATREQVAFEKQNLESEQAEFRKRSQPILFVQYVGFQSHLQRSWNHTFNVENTGQECSDVKLIIGENLITRAPLLRRGESIGASENFDSQELPEMMKIVIEYTDINGNRSRQSFGYVKGQFERI